MEGLVDYLIAANKEVEREISADSDARQAVLSHQELLAARLAGVPDEEIIGYAENGMAGSLRDKLTSDGLLRAHRLLERQQGLGIRTVSFCDRLSYPERLGDLGEERPVLLHYRGDWELLQGKAAGVVGSRKASHAGVSMAKDLGILYGGQEEDRDAWRGQSGCPDCARFPYLEEAPYVIVSGLARGCDTAAHKGCLSVGGETVAVVATGLDMAYPLENSMLQADIVKNGGLVVSEQVIGEKAGGHLLRRNRMIAALADVLIVVQCARDSGTMHAVEYARKLGRKILAVDYGFCVDMNDGNDYLLKQGIAQPIDYPF